MDRGKLLNLLLIVASVLVVTFFALSVRLEASPDTVTVMQADGIACERCAAVIAKALEAEKGVASVSVDAATGRVVVGYDSKNVGPEVLTSRVTTAGYACRILRTQTAAAYRTESGGQIITRKTSCCRWPLH